MLRTKALAAVSIAVFTAAAMLSSCAAQPDYGDSERVNSGGPASGVTTITYDGKPLDCVTWESYGGKVGFTCDFAKYYEERYENLTPQEQIELERLLAKAAGKGPR